MMFAVISNAGAIHHTHRTAPGPVLFAAVLHLRARLVRRGAATATGTEKRLQSVSGHMQQDGDVVANTAGQDEHMPDPVTMTHLAVGGIKDDAGRI